MVEPNHDLVHEWCRISDEWEFRWNHYITNSALLLGSGLLGGTVIGGTSDQKNEKVDLVTGMVDAENGVYLSHEHIARTLLYRLGVQDDLGA